MVTALLSTYVVANLGIVATFMGAHSIPDEFKKNPELYVDLICDIIIPIF